MKGNLRVAFFENTKHTNIMTKKIYALFLLFCLCIDSLLAQQDKKESFRIKDARLTDSSRVVVTLEMTGNAQPMQGEFKMLNETQAPLEIVSFSKAGDANDDSKSNTRLIYFLIDAANYTEGMALKNFKNAVKASLNELTDSDLMNVGYFGGEEVITFGKEFTANKGAFENDIETRLSATTDTITKPDAFKAMYDAIEKFKTSNKDGQKILIVISAGVKPPANSPYNTDDVIAYARKNDLTVHNIVFKINAQFDFAPFRLISDKTDGGTARTCKSSAELKNAIGDCLEKRIVAKKGTILLYSLTFLDTFHDGAEHTFKIAYAGTEQTGKYIANATGNSGLNFFTGWGIYILIGVVLIGVLAYWQLNEMRLKRLEQEEEEAQMREAEEAEKKAEITKRDRQAASVVEELRNQNARLEEQMRQQGQEFMRKAQEIQSQMQSTPTVVPPNKFDLKSTMISGGGGAPVLLVSAGTFSNNFYLNKPTINIGRAANNDIMIPEQTISNRHASITIENGSFFLTDLGSTNGTFLNGTRIDRGILKKGDVIKFGAANCRFEI